MKTATACKKSPFSQNLDSVKPPLFGNLVGGVVGAHYEHSVSKFHLTLEKTFHYFKNLEEQKETIPRLT